MSVLSSDYFVTDEKDWMDYDQYEWQIRKKYCETIFVEEKLLQKGIEFYNQYFGYKKYPMDRRDALLYARLALRIDADLWKAMMPMSPAKIEFFYTTNPFYFFHNMVKIMDGHHREIERELLEQKMEPPMLDFAGGSGGFSINFARRGWDVTYYDINKVQTAWVEWITKEWKLPITVAHSHEDIIRKKPFNFIIAKDFLEHVPNPIPLVEFLKSLLTKEGKMYLSEHKCAGPDEINPMHFQIKGDLEGEKKNYSIDLDFNQKCINRERTTDVAKLHSNSKVKK